MTSNNPEGGSVPALVACFLSSPILFSLSLSPFLLSIPLLSMYTALHYVDCSSLENKSSDTNEICHLNVKELKVYVYYWKPHVIKLQAIVKLFKFGFLVIVFLAL